MPFFRKKPVVVEANRWLKNGDHPLDYAKPVEGIQKEELVEFSPEHQKNLDWEGQLVRRYRYPGMDGQSICSHCLHTTDDHGWIDTFEGGHTVCPGDWIITGIKGEHYPCKPDIFEATYEEAATPDG